MPLSKADLISFRGAWSRSDIDSPKQVKSINQKAESKQISVLAISLELIFHYE
jgi:hypothetical protein